MNMLKRKRTIEGEKVKNDKEEMRQTRRIAMKQRRKEKRGAHFCLPWINQAIRNPPGLLPKKRQLLFPSAKALPESERATPSLLPHGHIGDQKEGKITRLGD